MYIEFAARDRRTHNLFTEFREGVDWIGFWLGFWQKYGGFWPPGGAFGLPGASFWGPGRPGRLFWEPGGAPGRARTRFLEDFVIFVAKS